MSRSVVVLLSGMLSFVVDAVAALFVCADGEDGNGGGADCGAGMTTPVRLPRDDDFCAMAARVGAEVGDLASEKSTMLTIPFFLNVRRYRAKWGNGSFWRSFSTHEYKMDFATIYQTACLSNENDVPTLFRFVIRFASFTYLLTHFRHED